jgi:hypothetical protein
MSDSRNTDIQLHINIVSLRMDSLYAAYTYNFRIFLSRSVKRST